MSDYREHIVVFGVMFAVVAIGALFGLISIYANAAKQQRTPSWIKTERP